MTMTRREFFEAVIANEANAVEIREFAQNEINKLDIRNAKRKSTPNKNTLANIPLKEKICEFLTDKGFTVGREIGAGIVVDDDGNTMSTNKAVALCRQLTEDGTLIVSEVKEKGGRKVKAWKLAE